MPRCFKPKKYRKIGNRIYELGDWYPTKEQAERAADWGTDENMTSKVVKSGSGYAHYWRYTHPSTQWLSNAVKGYRRGE